MKVRNQPKLRRVVIQADMCRIIYDYGHGDVLTHLSTIIIAVVSFILSWKPEELEEIIDLSQVTGYHIKLHRVHSATTGIERK